MKKKISVLVVLFLGIFGFTVSNAFSDVAPGDWYYPYVQQMVENGVMTGYPDGTFKPKGEMTRAEFASVLVKTQKIEPSEQAKINFLDVRGVHWGEPFVDLASQYLTGYISNGNFYFKPNDPVLREDAAVAIVAAKNLKDQEVDISLLNKFIDENDISTNLKRHVAIAVKNGLMNGNEDGKFNPQGFFTRAEVATLFCNIYKYEQAQEQLKGQEFEKLRIDEVEEFKKYSIGDVDKDGRISSSDAKDMMDYVESSVKNTEMEYLGDVFADGKVDIFDVITIKAYIYNEINTLPHSCGNYKVNYESYNKTNHKKTYTCSCGKVSEFEYEKHDTTNGACVCETGKVEVTYNLVDVNKDGKVDGTDATQISRYINNKTSVFGSFTE